MQVGPAHRRPPRANRRRQRAICLAWRVELPPTTKAGRHSMILFIHWLRSVPLVPPLTPAALPRAGSAARVSPRIAMSDRRIRGPQPNCYSCGGSPARRPAALGGGRHHSSHLLGSTFCDEWRVGGRRAPDAFFVYRWLRRGYAAGRLCVFAGADRESVVLLRDIAVDAAWTSKKGLCYGQGASVGPGA